MANLTIPCTDEEMHKALEKNIALQQFPKPLNASAPTDSGLVSIYTKYCMYNKVVFTLTRNLERSLAS